MNALAQLAADVAAADSQSGYLAHLRHVVIDSRPEPKRFSAAAYLWQWEWAAQLAPALEDIAGVRPGYAGPRCFWRTLARGHDKTTGLARVVNYLLAFSRRKLIIDAAAADADQAALLLAAMRREAELNPWMAARIKFTRDGAIGPGGELSVLTSDAPTAAGRIPDVVICDEVTHWRTRALWDMLYSGVTKRPDCVVVVITNAGVKDSWQWDVKEAAKAQPSRWLVYEAPGRLQTWMSEENLAADRKLLTPSEARRLLDNEWIDPAEEAGYLHPADIDACESLGRELGLVYNTRARRGQEYWASIDYGPKRDRTCLAVMHQRESGLLVIDRMDVWQGSRAEEIQIADIRVWLREAREQFPDLHLVLDPYQLLELAQDLCGHLHIERFEGRGGKANYEMAELLRSLIVNRQIAWYPGCGSLPLADGRLEDFRQELRGLVTKRTSYGYRIDHESTKHDDRTVTVGMGAVQLMARLPKQPFKAPPPVEKVPPTPLRPRALSAESRGLYGMS
jgi:hypothetical protein